MLHINTIEEVEEVMKAEKFPPLGERCVGHRGLRTRGDLSTWDVTG